MFEQAIRPGILAGSYPQQLGTGLSEFEQTVHRHWQAWCQQLRIKCQSKRQLIARIRRYDDELQTANDAALDQFISAVSQQLVTSGLQSELISRSFAAIREAAFRTLQKRHYDVQLYGGWLMINGLLAEMETGEGKTLTATLPACTAALAGIPVHVITANDYLAARDAELMRPLYERLGLTVGYVVDGMEVSQRQRAYQCDIVHSTSQQIAFDYLRDRLEMGNETGSLRWQYQALRKQRQNGGKSPLLLRGLCFAIVDEGDNVLIDEAVTPLIITRTLTEAADPQIYADALFMASMLVVNDDFTIDQKTRMSQLTVQGAEVVAGLSAELDAFWQNPRQRDTLVQQALAAQHSYHNNKHYIVKDNKIQLVDERTGRVMADRSWEQGLQQMVEAKEGCVISERREPLARISYQQFFNRYLRLAATSGTAVEVAQELKLTYGLNVMKVPPHRPSLRKLLPVQIFASTELKLQVLVQTVETLFKQRRPVLIGTRTVAESETIGELLTAAGLPHHILNAKQDQHEAEVIERAGKLMAVTVATNMAGRGTDIGLGKGVRELGGLHVISLSFNDSGRVDRQLFGRSARQGDPGSAQAIFSLQDPEVAHCCSSAMLKVASWFCWGERALPSFMGRWLVARLQRAVEKTQKQSRKALARQDRQFRKMLAFAGKFE